MLPHRFRLEGSLKNCGGTPFERDFMVSARLQYLHILFLLHSLLLDRSFEVDTLLLKISQEILSLVVEAIVLKNRLANSGTGLYWKGSSFYSSDIFT